MGLTMSRNRDSHHVRFTPLRDEGSETRDLITMEELSMENKAAAGVGRDSSSDDELKDFNTSNSAQLIEDGDDIPTLSRCRLVVLNIGWFGAFFMFLSLSLQIVPAQMRAFVGDGAKARDLGFMAAGGGIVTLLVSPAVGMASDRIKSRFGRRRPFMVAGTILISLFLIGCAIVGPHDDSVFERNVNTNSSNDTVCYNSDFLKYHRCHPSNDTNSTDHYHGIRLGFYVLFYLLGIGSYAMATMPYNGLIADLTHPTQRGFVSGVMGALQILGSVSAAIVGAFVQDIGLFWVFIIIIFVFGGCMGITVFSVTERKNVRTPPRLSVSTLLAGYFQPLKNWDFFWVFFTRFLMQMGVGTALGFLQYWVQDMIVLPRFGGGCMSPITAVSMLFLPLLVVAAVCSVVGGIVSDKLKRRKLLVIIAAVVMGIGAALAAGLPYFAVATVIAVLFGAGYGTYTSVDFALVMDVLKSKEDYAKDIAVWHQALVLPQTFATLIGGLIVSGLNSSNCESGLGYIVLFTVTAFYFVLSGVFVLCIRKVR